MAKNGREMKRMQVLDSLVADDIGADGQSLPIVNLHRLLRFVAIFSIMHGCYCLSQFRMQAHVRSSLIGNVDELYSGAVMGSLPRVTLAATALVYVMGA